MCWKGGVSDQETGLMQGALSLKGLWVCTRKNAQGLFWCGSLAINKHDFYRDR